MAKPSDELISILKDETNIKEIVWTQKAVESTTVELDTNLTQDLIDEGEYRDLARSIQVLRITSYNVCYTKLLRSLKRPYATLKDN